MTDKITITVAGGPKTGKSTLAALVYDTLCKRGFEVELVDEDGEGDRLHLMKGRNARIITNLTERSTIEVKTCLDKSEERKRELASEKAAGRCGDDGCDDCYPK